jgi:hypothetical protein
MALKKEAPPELNENLQGHDQQPMPDIAEDEFDTLDTDAQGAAVEDVNGFPETVLMDEVGDPDISVLAQDEELFHDDVIDLKSPEVAAELSEDPVRLYLREIGLVKLLDSDSEFRLATLIEANRLVTTYRRRPLRKNMTVTCAIYHALLADMVTSWERLLEDA